MHFCEYHLDTDIFQKESICYQIFSDLQQIRDIIGHLKYGNVLAFFYLKSVHLVKNFNTRLIWLDNLQCLFICMSAFISLRSERFTAFMLLIGEEGQ